MLLASCLSIKSHGQSAIKSLMVENDVKVHTSYSIYTYMICFYVKSNILHVQKFVATHTQYTLL